MKRRDFINLRVSAVLCLMPGLALLSCSGETNPIDVPSEGSDVPSAVFVPLAQTQATIEGQLPNDGSDHVGRLLTITDAVPVIAFHCALSWNDYVCTVSDQDGGASITRTCSLPDTRVIVVGDQFEVQTQTPCNGQLDLTLTVHTQSPEALINLLIGEVRDLVESGVLDSGNGNALLATLDQALTAITTDRPSTANLLNAFINQVEGFIAGGILIPGEGQALIDDAQFVIDQLNG